MRSPPGRPARALGLCLFSLVGVAANCQEQFAATFDHDGGLIQVREERDAAASDVQPGDIWFEDVSTPDREAPDTGAADLATTDSGVGDGSAQDRSAIDTAAGDSGSADSGAGYHPGNWLVDHRAAALLGQSDCRACHGADLTGGFSGSSCDLCHQSDWRTNCTYCHGGGDNQTGAPPIDLHGQTATGNSSVGAHSEHVAMAARNHPDYGCAQCHVQPTDVLSPGHLFDDTPGQAELVFSGGLSASGAYSFAAATCSALYCHGTGRSDGTAPPHSGTIDTCTACHAGTASTSEQLATMSGRHALHLGLGVTCAICHNAVVDSSDAIIAPDLHVDGEKNVNPVGGSYSGGTCTNVCHTSGSGPWQGPVPDGGLPEGGVIAYHTDPLWATAGSHGLAAEEGQSNCFTCHGSQLQGVGTAVSCDSCHASGWRSNCVFCHGGNNGDTSGAPPVDLHDNLASSITTVGAHRAHLQRTNHPAWDCTQCHVKPSSATSAGHMFDAVNDTTAGAAEVGLGAGLSPAGNFDASATTCSNLYCHGSGSTNGSAPAFTTMIDSCNACHPDSTTPASWPSMSGAHDEHLQAGVGCASCHAAVVNSSNAIVNPDLHVNGAKNWACTTCHATRGWTDGAAHPAGFASASSHGLAFENGSEDCRICHGAQLTGAGSANSCDGCHSGGTPTAWRTNCVFCHGGASGDTTGRPPYDLDNATANSVQTVGAHVEHVSGGAHLTYDCNQCHVKPTTLLATGHVLDGTPGAAEVVYSSSGALSPAGSYSSSTATCSNLYCHGNGMASGRGSAPAFTTTINNCNACHPDWTMSSRWPSMSGEHDRHIQIAGCNECHSGVINGANAIVGAALHANGQRNTQFPSGVTYSGGRCSGTCHGENHSSAAW